MKAIKIREVPEEAVRSELFTGPVTRQPIITTQQSKQFVMSQVNFGKGVRNKFHTHTSDQVLIVTSGKGICATDKEEVTVVPGDVILFPAGENHWHGAAPGSEFAHIYVTSPDSKTTQTEK